MAASPSVIKRVYSGADDEFLKGDNLHYVRIDKFLDAVACFPAQFRRSRAGRIASPTTTRLGSAVITAAAFGVAARGCVGRRVRP